MLSTAFNIVSMNAFGGTGFWTNDEIYQFNKDVYTS
jgi:hypothetical protein